LFTKRRLLLAFLLGALSALALPPIHFLPVLAVAIPVLLALIGEAESWRRAAATGWCFGFGLYVVGLYWITEAILIEAARFWWLVPLAVPALAAVLAGFVAASCVAAWWARPGWRRAVALAGAWVLADLARQFVATGFPWNPWGSVWAMPNGFGDVMQQPAAVIGVHGLTLLTLLVAATPALGRRAMALGVAGLLAWGGFGLWRLSLPVIPAPPLDVVLVQGNVPQGQKQSRAFALAAFRRYLALTAEGVARAGAVPTVAVWPETASPFALAVDPNARAAIAEAARGPALIGSVRWGADGRPRNALMALAGGGPPVAVYDKWHLVPFGEYQPSWAEIGIQLVPGGGFAPGPGPRTLHVPGLPPVGPLICYEAIFPAQVVDEADRPDWLVNVTNDAWFGNSSGPRQHLAAARMRAVEEGLPLLRAANTGISAGFDAFGREQARLGMNRTGTLVVRLPGRLPPTPFARFGLTLPGLLAALCLAAAFARRRSAPAAAHS
jgi:apolipoprotein N-acyltransferase